MFDDCGPIHAENVPATLDDVIERFIVGQLKLNPDTDIRTLGSTGKKLPGNTSGDLDFAIDFNKLQKIWDLPEWDGKQRQPEWVDLAQSAAKACGVDFNMAGTVCSLDWPIVSDDGMQDGEKVQVDLMPHKNLKMISFGRFSQRQKSGETFFKGTIRNIMLSIMAAASHHADLTDETHTKTLSDGTTKEVHNEYEGWTYDGNTGLHLAHKKYFKFGRKTTDRKTGITYQAGDWQPHAKLVESPVISDDPEEIVQMIFGKGVTLDDVDTVQKVWMAWKKSPAVKKDPELVQKVRERIENSAKGNPDLKWPDFDSEEFVNEARKPKEPKPEKKKREDMTPEEIEALHQENQRLIDEYLATLDDSQIEKINDRCAELIAKWGKEQEGDLDYPMETVRNFMSGSSFLKMIQHLTTTRAPAKKHMGANTFVDKFFELPFDAEAYIGKVAKDKGISWHDAADEYVDSIVSCVNVGRMAHNIADNAIKGEPPMYKGSNMKEDVIFRAIYDYAKELTKDADHAESECSLKAKDVYLGGRFDLMFNKGNEYTLVDWKVYGEDLKDIPTGKMGLDDVVKDMNNNSYNKYALQLNVYEWAARNGGQIPEGATVKRELHQFQYDDGKNALTIKCIPIPDMQKLVGKMVKRAVELGIIRKKDADEAPAKRGKRK